MVHINLYPYNPQQASVSYPFLSIDTSVNADADAGQGFTLKSMFTHCPSLTSTNQLFYGHNLNI